MIYRLLSGKHRRFEDGQFVTYVPGDLIDLSEREAYTMRNRIVTEGGLKPISMEAPAAKAIEKRGALARDAARARAARSSAGGGSAEAQSDPAAAARTTAQPVGNPAKGGPADAGDDLSDGDADEDTSSRSPGRSARSSAREKATYTVQKRVGERGYDVVSSRDGSAVNENALTKAEANELAAEMNE